MALTLARRCIAFSEWLEINFDLDNFESAVITRKAEETFLPNDKKPVDSLADEWLKRAVD